MRLLPEEGSLYLHHQFLMAVIGHHFMRLSPHLCLCHLNCFFVSFWRVHMIAYHLLAKILTDLRNTREEAINVAELKSQCHDTSSITVVEEHKDHRQKNGIKNEESRRTCLTSEKSMDPDDDDDKEIKYRLDPKYANVRRTPQRHVRTCLYFTLVCKIKIIVKFFFNV